MHKWTFHRRAFSLPIWEGVFLCLVVGAISFALCTVVP